MLALALLLLLPRAASACSCIGDVPLCQSFWQADAVFSGEVLSFEKINQKELFSRRVARIKVERAWRGTAEGTIEVLTGAGGGDCGFTFSRGKQYLVYAYRAKNGALTTNVCSPTKLLSRAAADLAYFKDAEKPSSGGRVYGLARFETKGSEMIPARGIVITLTGESETRTAVADREGRFEFAGLPAGEYAAHMAGATTPPWKVTLRDPRACVNVNLWAPQPAKRPSKPRE